MQYDLNKAINFAMKNFFDTISKVELPSSDKLNGRDFIHLYNFQKHLIHRFIKSVTELVKIKQLHYWNMTKNIQSWQHFSEY